MIAFTSIDQVLDYAIEQENEAFIFYQKLAEQSQNTEMQQTFQGFAREELGHKNRLIAMKEGKPIRLTKDTVPNLGIADYVVEVPVHPDMGYQHALITAMRNEKKAYKLYMDLAALIEDADLQEVFFSLAREEANHKLRFEIEYDDIILIEN